jgi:hypothetical protein
LIRTHILWLEKSWKLRGQESGWIRRSKKLSK